MGIDRVVNALVKRDGLTKEQAIDQVNETMDIMQSFIDEGDFTAAEEFFTSDTGLEPDYIMDLYYY